MSGRASAQPGRPRGNTAAATRQRIVDVARSEFASRGYQATSLRSIADGADIDASLIRHYFNDKAGLFIATLALPVDPLKAIRAVLKDGTAYAGKRLVAAFIATWDPHHDVLIMLMRTALDSPGEQATEIYGLGQQILVPELATTIEGPDSQYRAGLIAAQMLGLATVRYVLALEPLASASPDSVATIYGPAVQQILDGAVAEPGPSERTGDHRNKGEQTGNDRYRDKP